MSWQTVLYFLLWAGAFAVMMRFGCAHVMGHGRMHEGPSGDTGHAPHGDGGMAAPEKSVDPVCGMPVNKAGAKSCAYQGRVFYFCSQSCREKFEAAPASFATRVNAVVPHQEHRGA